jgi:hypothetical protein
VRADAALVWDVLADFQQWPEWHADVKWVKLGGQVEPGTEFTWRTGMVTIRSRLLHVDRPHSITWSGKMSGVSAIHSWQFESLDGGTRVRTEESWDSLLVRLLQWPLRRVLKASLDAFLRCLKAEAERRAGD